MRVAYINNCGLAEFAGEIAAVVYFQGCDMDCDYCQNPKLIDKSGEAHQMDDEQLINQISWKNIDGVSFTGGEPLCQIAFPQVVKVARYAFNIGKKVNLDTNGHFTQEKFNNLNAIYPYLTTLSVDIKYFTPGHIDGMLMALKFPRFLGKCVFRTVLVNNVDKKNSVAGNLLKMNGITKIRVLRNSLGGKGANLGETKDSTVEDFRDYYKRFGIDVIE